MIVEKLNFVKRHTKARGTGSNQQGGIIEKEAPIHLSNVMLVDPKLGRGRAHRSADQRRWQTRAHLAQAGDVISKNI